MTLRLSEDSPHKPDLMIVDFDGTLFDRGKPIQKVIDFVIEQEQRMAVCIVTSRSYSNSKVLSAVRAKGIKAEAGLVNGEGKDNPMMKALVVSRMQKKANILLALDNNPDVLVEYRALGIEARHPDEL